MATITVGSIVETMADMLDVPEPEIRFDVEAYLAKLDEDLDREVRTYLAFWREVEA